MKRLVASLAAAALASTAWAQSPPAPRPFPQPGSPRPQPSAPAPAPAAQEPAPASAAAAIPAAGEEQAPSEAVLGVTVYPAATFLRSYDAGRGQRYYLFGTLSSYADMVAYYRTLLRTRGDQVFDQPPTHMFETSRFRDDRMAFPPSVTIKDYTWSGSGGLPNPTPGGQPERFPTIIQIVPPPPGEPR